MQPNQASFSIKQVALTDDLTLAYREAGTGIPVILLHGLADHSLVWQSLAQHLGDRYRCLAPDLRGHGDSSKPPAAEYDARLIADDLEQFCEQLQVGTVAVVAHSWAAKVALLWAQQCPQRLRHLILVDPFFVNRLSVVFRPTFPILYRTLPFLKVMGPFADLEQAQALAQGLKQYQGWSEPQQAIFHAGMEQQADGQWRSKFAIAARNGVFEDILQSAGLTAPLPTPTTLLLPAQGLNRMAWQTRPYHQYLMQLQVHLIPGNHWPHLVEPESFNQAIATALNQMAVADPS
ncbi:alpha/beta fold hydrolase [Leptolyngbya iicbica]|uniref:Alpha/beta hydrolase n=2 Tax=Cyanophyceae TaxID=3028117 RepID=A0A4Q7E9Y4_9CYAN|nr:alpha/beta hydrolase [Leptolyngbya sp. LK]RZM79259.1 alpha/beta hydrolase [Leptolyngbya sp. LK]